MSDRLVQSASVLLAAAAFAGAAMLLPGLDRDRRESKLVYEPSGAAQKDVAFRLIENMGALRGMAVNVLWNQLGSIQQEGRYYEADALARRITELQPRMPEVWRHMAYNEAYNISVKCQTQEERWAWVCRGLRLLASEGIPNNPEAEPLYRELAWIYQHKIGAESDDMNRWYRKRLAERWQILLGVPAFGKLRAKDGGEEYAAIAQMRPVAEVAQKYFTAPGGARVAALSPAAASRFASDFPDGAHALGKLAEAFKSAGAGEAGVSPRLAEAAGRVLAFGDYAAFAAESGISGLSKLAEDRLGGDGRLVVKAIQSDARAQKGMGELLPLLRASALIAGEGMDPAAMLATMEKYGPLDWRHAQSHALYWASQGAARALNSDGVTKINTDRIVIAGAQGLFDGGRLFYDPVEDSLSEQPDPRFIKTYDETLKFVRRRLANHEYEMDKSLADSFGRGEENFLHRAIQVSLMFGDEADARAYYERVKREFPDSLVYSRHYNLSLPDFVVVTIRQDSLPAVQKGAMIGMINRGLEAMLLENNASRAQVLFKMAAATRDGIEKDFKDAAVAVIGTDESRQGPPPMEKLFSDALLRFVTSPEHTLRQRAAAYRRLPGEARLSLFDVIEKTVYPQVRASGLPVAPEDYFPPPEGLAEYRAKRAQQAK